MIDYAAEIRDSWVRSAPSTRDLAALLGLAMPVTLHQIAERLRSVESITVQRDVHTDDDAAINGRVMFELRSNGTYVFSGHMRATGAASYDYGIQAWVATGAGSAIGAQRRGKVSPSGQRQDNWSQPGTNEGLIDEWRSLRDGHSIGFQLQANIGGALGTALDVLEFAVKGFVANIVLGPTGWLILIGDELAGIDAQILPPDLLAGVLVGGGLLLITGPFGLVPATVAGVATADRTRVRHRPMTQHERNFASAVFGFSIEYDRIMLTNMGDLDGGRFTWPYLGRTILVNLGDDQTLDSPTTYSNIRYPAPGQLFIHELMHAWQLHHQSLVRIIHKHDQDYGYYAGWIGGFPNNPRRLTDTSWQMRAWEEFKTEEQATIVDEWYSIHHGAGSSVDAIRTSLESVSALRDPAFRFMLDTVRAAAVP